MVTLCFCRGFFRCCCLKTALNLCWDARCKHSGLASVNPNFKAEVVGIELSYLSILEFKNRNVYSNVMQSVRIISGWHPIVCNTMKQMHADALDAVVRT